MAHKPAEWILWSSLQQMRSTRLGQLCVAQAPPLTKEKERKNIVTDFKVYG